jgi:glycosyltransferase involved in cell wall biosynthesis
MRDHPTVGLAIIARDEEASLPRLLQSISGAFDQVVLVDTGSKDGTTKVFEEWARTEAELHPGFRWIVDRFEWIDDFSAARNHADSLLTTDWLVWADADDEISGAENIRAVVR